MPRQPDPAPCLVGDCPHECALLSCWSSPPACILLEGVDTEPLRGLTGAAPKSNSCLHLTAAGGARGLTEPMVSAEGQRAPQLHAAYDGGGGDMLSQLPDSVASNPSQAHRCTSRGTKHPGLPALSPCVVVQEQQARLPLGAHLIARRCGARPNAKFHAAGKAKASSVNSTSLYPMLKHVGLRRHRCKLRRARARCIRPSLRRLPTGSGDTGQRNFRQQFPPPARTSDRLGDQDHHQVL